MPYGGGGNGGGLLPDSVRSEHIRDGEVQTDDLADGAVQGDKIADSSVGAGKMDQAPGGGPPYANSVLMHDWSGDQLVFNFIGADSLADGCVTEPKLADGAVTNAKIADAQVDESKLADLSVSTRTIQAEAVTEDKLAPDAVTGNAIAEAAGKRKAKDAEDEGPGALERPPSLADQVTDLRAAPADAVQRTVGVRGTFSAMAAERLGAGDELTEAAKETARNTKRLVQMADAGGLVFD